MSDSSSTGAKKKPDALRRGFVAWPVGVMLALLWLWQEVFPNLETETIAYSDFKRKLAAHEIAKVVVEADSISGEFAPAPNTNAPAAGTAPTAPTAIAQDSPPAEAASTFRTIRLEDPKLVEELEAAGVEFVGSRPRFLSQLLLAWVLPIGLMMLAWGFLSKRMAQATGSALGFGKTAAKVVSEERTGVTFADVAGCDEAKQELREVVDFLRTPERYEALGAKIPKGVLLLGPPGTGKTLLARAVAGEANVPFYSISGSNFVEMFAGVGAARVRDLFEQAKREAPAIVFIDEIDAIGRQRGVHLGVVNDEREQTLNQLLVELDGFEVQRRVILLAATNRPDVLDPALLRPGRFDRQVVLDAPDAEGRRAILEVHRRGKTFADDLDLTAIARATPGFSGADLANMLNEAALLAARRGASSITQADVESAIEKVLAGPERRSRRLDHTLKERIAYHEAGHALVAHLSPLADPVQKISIVPRGQAALGYTLQVPAEDRFLFTKGELEAKVRGLLGGLAAERLVFGEHSTGASNDLERATAIVRQMICTYGMGEAVGLAHCSAPEVSPFLRGMTDTDRLRDVSDATARDIDQEVRACLATARQEATSLLEQHRASLDRVAHALLEHETLDVAGFERLVRDNTPPQGTSHGTAGL